MLYRYLFLFWFLTFGAVAQEAAAPETPPPPPPLEPSHFASLWVDKTAQVAPEAVAATVAALKKQTPDPEHVILMIHGFDVPRDSSTLEFDALAQRCKEQFAPSKTKVAFAGVQWASAAETSVFKLANVYWEKISVARSVGRGPTRQLLFAVREAFPKAHISIFAHSMGCEVLAAALVPEIEYADQVPFVETFRPQSDVKLLMTAMCGSDLDYDIWSKSQASARNQGERSRLLWSTVSPYTGKVDKVLSMRARLRGKAAGSAFPKMTLEQLDESISKRRLLLDANDIPTDHKFGRYFDQARLARMIPVMQYLVDPKLPKPSELSELDTILAAPNELDVLRAFLDRSSYGGIVYALWRLERLNCGDARHLTDGTLDAIARMLKDKPQMIWREQGKTECVTVRDEIFPTEAMMTRAGAPPRARKR